MCWRRPRREAGGRAPNARRPADARLRDQGRGGAPWYRHRTCQHSARASGRRTPHRLAATRVLGFPGQDHPARPAVLPHLSLAQLRVAAKRSVSSRHDLAGAQPHLRRVACPIAPLSHASWYRLHPSRDAGVLLRVEDHGNGAHLAAPEKALVDFLYLGPARSRLFRALPELGLPPKFSVKRARAILARIEPPRRPLVGRALERALAPPEGKQEKEVRTRSRRCASCLAEAARARAL